MKNLKKALKTAKITQNDLGKYLDVSQATISRYIDGSIIIPSDILLKVSNYLNVSTDYLLGRTDQPDNRLVADKMKQDMERFLESLAMLSVGEREEAVRKFRRGSYFKTPVKTPPVNFFDPKDRSSFAAVPLLEDAIAAGKPVHISDRVENRLYFTKKFLINFINPFLIRVGKDQRSMEPTLLPGDLLLIDRRPIEKCRRDCIYAINHPEEGGTIKRCAVAGDRLILAPDNPAYSNVFIRLENVDLSSILVGTVVWTGRELKRS